MAQTQYIYRSKDGWVLQSEGRARQTFDTQGEALAWATENGKQVKPSQIVVFGNDGRILQQKRFGAFGIREHPKRGRLNPRKIATAVGKVTLDRLKAAYEFAS